MDDGNGSLPWHLYVRVHICLPRGSVSLPFRLYVEFPRFTTNGMKPNASNTMSAKSLKRLMTRQRYKKNRFIQADFPENICSIDIFCYKEQIKVAFTIGTSNQKQVLLGYQLLIVVSLNHYNLLDYADT